VAQIGQGFDVLHRSGNVHDSNGSLPFIAKCVGRVRAELPKARVETRMDSAFFSDAGVRELERLGVEYSVSVPFERFVELKGMIESRRRWKAVPGRPDSSYFEVRWKPKSWRAKARFIFIRTLERKQSKEPVQLDLFRPVDHQYQYKVIVTNKGIGAGRVAAFHEGRGYQEQIFGDMKQHVHMGYIPCRRRNANVVWLLCGMLAHNLGRELQLEAGAPSKPSTMKRTALWVFESLATLRRNVVQRAGRITRPQGKLTITLPDIPALRSEILRYT